MWIAESYKKLVEMSNRAGPAAWTSLFSSDQASTLIWCSMLSLMIIHKSNDADHLCEEDCYYCEASSSSDSTSANDGTVTNNIVKECKQKKFEAEQQQGKQGFVVNPKRLIFSYLDMTDQIHSTETSISSSNSDSNMNHDHMKEIVAK